jgi:hypothetical protein
MTTLFPSGGDGDLRMGAAKYTLESWDEKLKYGGDINLVISDDGSPDKREQELVAFATESGRWSKVESTRQERRGVGASLNQGFELATKRGDLVLYAVDDWSLEMELDIDPWAEVLEQDEQVGCIRLGESSPNLAWGFQSHWVVERGHVFGMWFDPWSKSDADGNPIQGPGPHYAWCQRPALYHPRFFETYGKFREMTTAIQLDWIHNDHVARTAGPKIVLALLNPWRHVGSVQLSKVQP